jgi:PleD family two-component response regulator
VSDSPVVGNPPIVALSRDVFFGMRIRTILRQVGFEVRLVKDEMATVDAVNTENPALVLVDFNAPVDWDALSPVVGGNVPVLGFGSHTDVDGFRAAKAAGVNRVVSNGEFSRSLPDLVARYARDGSTGG